jgi:predicted MFS family arabinose efflux permease
MMIGPVLGSLLYKGLGYAPTFYTFAIFLAIATVFIIFLIPKSANQISSEQPKQEEVHSQGNKYVEVTYKMFFTNARALLAGFASTIAMMFLLSLESIISIRFSDLGVSEDNIGYIFAVMCLTFALGSILTGYLCKYLSTPVITVGALVFSTISLILLGPSQFLHIENPLPCIIIGFSLLSFFCSFILVPQLQEILVSVKQNGKVDPKSSILNDKASAFMNGCIGVGSIIAPIMGGLLNYILGF